MIDMIKKEEENPNKTRLIKKTHKVSMTWLKFLLKFCIFRLNVPELKRYLLMFCRAKLTWRVVTI